MAIRKNLTSADIEVLGQAEIRRRKATQGTCSSCFTRGKLNDEGLCQTCVEDRKPADTSGKQSLSVIVPPHEDVPFTISGGTNQGKPRHIVQLAGPIHSPAYLGSCAQSGLPHQTINGVLVPHPAALGSLPANATLNDYAHYASARGGHFDPDEGVMHIDLRTAEQRDPNHRSYVETPIMVTQKVTHLPTRPSLKTSGSEESVNYTQTKTVPTINLGFRQSSGTVQELLENTRALVTPEEEAIHDQEHGGADSSDRYRDEKGLHWLNQPDTCRLCKTEQTLKTAAWEHAQGQHAGRVDPLCPNC